MTKFGKKLQSLKMKSRWGTLTPDEKAEPTALSSAHPPRKAPIAERRHEPRTSFGPTPKLAKLVVPNGTQAISIVCDVDDVRTVAEQFKDWE